MEINLITEKNFTINLKIKEKNSILIKEIKSLIEKEYGYDKNKIKIIKSKIDNNKEIELDDDYNIDKENNQLLILKNIKFIEISYKLMKEEEIPNNNFSQSGKNFAEQFFSQFEKRSSVFFSFFEEK